MAQAQMCLASFVVKAGQVFYDKFKIEIDQELIITMQQLKDTIIERLNNENFPQYYLRKQLIQLQQINQQIQTESYLTLQSNPKLAIGVSSPFQPYIQQKDIFILNIPYYSLYCSDHTSDQSIQSGSCKLHKLRSNAQIETLKDLLRYMGHDENTRVCFQNLIELNLNYKLTNLVFNEQNPLIIKFALEQSSREFENYMIIQQKIQKQVQNYQVKPISIENKIRIFKSVIQNCTYKTADEEKITLEVEQQIKSELYQNKYTFIEQINRQLQCTSLVTESDNQTFASLILIQAVLCLGLQSDLRVTNELHLGDYNLIEEGSFENILLKSKKIKKIAGSNLLQQNQTKQQTIQNWKKSPFYFKNTLFRNSQFNQFQQNILDAIDSLRVKTDVAVVDSSNTALLLLNQIKQSELSPDKCYQNFLDEGTDQLQLQLRIATNQYPLIVARGFCTDLLNWYFIEISGPQQNQISARDFKKVIEFDISNNTYKTTEIFEEFFTFLCSKIAQSFTEVSTQLEQFEQSLQQENLNNLAQQQNMQQ